LQDSITKTKNYLPVLEENLTKSNNNKINNLIEKQQKKINQLDIAVNPHEAFNRLKQLELEKLENKLYWNLRKEETSFNKKSNDESNSKLEYEGKLK
jgi:hypothetical protein